MRSLFDVELNRQEMTSLSDKIIVRDIVEEPIEEDVTKYKRSIAPGQSVIRKVRRALAVKVVYVIRERDPIKRSEIVSKVYGWAANGGLLYTSNRVKKVYDEDESYTQTGRQLTRVVLTEPPVQDSALKWTQDLSLTFTAFDPPYWEDLTANTRRASLVYDGTQGLYVYNGIVNVFSTAPETPISAVITNSSADMLLSLMITVGKAFFHFENLGIDSGGQLYIDYDEDTGLLRISDDRGISYMSSRTADSTDELYYVPGANDVKIIANTQCTCEMTHRERYL